jgi:hypothetical protein
MDYKPRFALPVERPVCEPPTVCTAAGSTCAISARCLITSSPPPHPANDQTQCDRPRGIDPLANEGIDRQWKYFYIRKMGIHVRKHTIYAELPSHLEASQRLRMVTESAMGGSVAVHANLVKKVQHTRRVVCRNT